MGEMIRSFDWSKTSIGTPDHWPQSLRTTLGIALHSAFPIFLFWDKDLICFYNDAFRPSLGVDGKHPAIGKKGKEVWPEIWEFIGPLIEQVMTTGEPVWFEDQLVPFYRNGRMEDIYWTFSYSPAYGDDGEVNGVFVTCTETTEKVLTVKKLLASENRFHALIQEATVGIVVLMGDNNVVEIVNNAYAKLVGRSYQDLIGKGIFDVFPETSQFKSIIDTVRNSGEPYYSYDQPYVVLVNGKEKKGFLNLVYQPYFENSETVKGVMVLCHDVTEQVLARKRLEETDSLLRSIVESAPFPIGVYMGREMRIELVNQALMDVWGKGNNIVGKTYAEVLPELESQKIYPQLDGVFTTGIPFHARNQRVDLLIDGKLQPFYFNYSFTPLFNASGQVYGVMNTAAEVTDLNIAKQKVEQSERNFRNMILQAPVAMCILLGPAYVIEVANDMMIELWGKPPTTVLKKPLFEALPDAREQGLEQILGNVYKKGETFKAHERPVTLRRNGREETMYLDFVYEPYRDGDGTVLGILAISIDVTEQVRARHKIEEIVAERTRELELANYNLKRSNAELAQFAYIASHDLQEPVRKIRTFSQMLENRAADKIDEPSRSYLTKINTASARMHTLIRDVLTYSELVNSEVFFADVNLNQTVEGVLADYELLIEQKGATINVKNLPTLEAIPLHMSQLFGNLIGNALKFSKKDIKPVITITGSRPTKEELIYSSLNPQGDFYKIQVADNGIGFKKEYAEQIFNIFQRLHRKAEFEGTGIGLAMCKKIALNHHGDINTEGSSEQGAVFNVFLPAKQVRTT